MSDENKRDPGVTARAGRTGSHVGSATGRKAGAVVGWGIGLTAGAVIGAAGGFMASVLRRSRRKPE
jgi:hypothetical protein